MKFKTVQEGEQAVVLNNLGEGRLITGPSRVSGVVVVEYNFIIRPSKGLTVISMPHRHTGVNI